MNNEILESKIQTLLFCGKIDKNTVPEAVISPDEDLRDTFPRPPNGTIALFDGSQFIDTETKDPKPDVIFRQLMAEKFGPVVTEFILPSEKERFYWNS